MGPLFWNYGKLRKCDERTREKCTDHLDCCAVTSCTYCLELEYYNGDIFYGTAEQSGNIWSGSVDGFPFEAYWERDYFSNECEFTVIFNGENVYGRGCYDGISCRDSSDEAPVEIGYDSATLRWKRYLSRPLPHWTDPDTGCKTWWCGECECSCQCLCITITDSQSVVTKGEICDVSYTDCDGPVWAGMIGYYDLEFVLGRNIYNECILIARVDGTDQDPVQVSGCKNLSTTIELYDGTVISVKCKICSCEALYNSLCCPEPLGPVVYVTGGLIVGSVALTCQNCTAENQEDYIARVYTGEYVTDWMYAVGYGSLCSVTHNWKAKIRLFFTWTCGSGMNLSIHASVAENAPGYDVAVLDATVVENVVVECSPLFNVYENLCPANDWFFAPNACIGAIARCTEFPETYVVTE